MNKEHLAKLQDKVNRLMRTSSEESDSQSPMPSSSFATGSPVVKQVEPETLRKCIDLIKQNKQLKLMLEKQRKKSQQLRKQLVKTRKEKEQGNKVSETKIRQQPKIDQISAEQLKKMGRLQVELEEANKKNTILTAQLAREKKKNKKLYLFINDNLPAMEQNLDRLTFALDAKLQAHFSRIY